MKKLVRRAPAHAIHELFVRRWQIQHRGFTANLRIDLLHSLPYSNVGERPRFAPDHLTSSRRRKGGCSAPDSIRPKAIGDVDRVGGAGCNLLVSFAERTPLHSVNASNCSDAVYERRN